MTDRARYLDRATVERLSQIVTSPSGHVDDGNITAPSDLLDDPVQRSRWQARLAAAPDLRPAGTLRTGQSIRVGGDWRRVVDVAWTARRTRVTLDDGTERFMDSAALVERRLEQDVTA